MLRFFRTIPLTAERASDGCKATATSHGCKVLAPSQGLQSPNGGPPKPRFRFMPANFLARRWSHKLARRRSYRNTGVPNQHDQRLMSREQKKPGPPGPGLKFASVGAPANHLPEGKKLPAYGCQSGRITAPHVTQQGLHNAN